MLAEISKLEAIRAIGLPADLFAGIAPNVVAGWRARAAVESPVHLREHPQPTKLTLLCALLAVREREVSDSLAQLLISTVHRINAHAEEKVDRRAREGLQSASLVGVLVRTVSPAANGGSAVGALRRGALAATLHTQDARPLGSKGALMKGGDLQIRPGVLYRDDSSACSFGALMPIQRRVHDRKAHKCNTANGPPA